jgi:putative ABC transport system substrate-binding protein
MITVACLFFPTLACSYDLLIVQSQRSPAYDEALRGLRSVARFSERLVVLTDYNEFDLPRVVREESPLVIVTLGDKALNLARRIRQTPVIALMTLGFRAEIDGGHPALTGVGVELPPERYMAVFRSFKVKRVGVISNSSRSTSYLRQAKRAAAEYGIELVIRDVKSSREVTTQLDALAGSVELLWMLPDSVTASREAADAQFLFSARQKIPVVTFSNAYLASGAATALEFDRYDIGRQAGEMAQSLLQGVDIEAVPPQSPRKATIRNNPSVLRHLGARADITGARNPE